MYVVFERMVPLALEGDRGQLSVEEGVCLGGQLGTHIHNQQGPGEP